MTEVSCNSTPSDTPPEDPRREVLRGKSPSAVLRKVHEDETIGLGKLCRDRLLERSILMETTRLHLRAMARVSLWAMFYHDDPPLDEWFQQCIDRSITDLLYEDYDSEKRQVPHHPQFGKYFEYVAGAAGSDKSLGRSMCVAFNTLPDPVREAFYRTVVQNKGAFDYVKECGRTKDEVALDVARALRAMLTLEDYPVFNPWAEAVRSEQL